MHLLTIFREGAEPSRARLGDGVYPIGSGERCRIRLPAPGVSERHAILALRGDSATIEDMRSETGTRLNAVPVDKPTPVLPTTPVTIGPYTLVVSPVPAAAPTEPAVESPKAESPKAGSPKVPDRGIDPPGPRTRGPADDSAAAIRRDVKRQIHAELVERLDIKRLAASRVEPAELRRRAQETVAAILAETADRLPAGLDPARLGKEILDEALGLGPLEELLADDSVSEIMVNGAERVYVERHGRLERTDLRFTDDASVMAVVERIVSPLGRRVDESQPYVDARLPDGSRVNVVIHPLSLVGPCVTIRKFASRQLFDRDLVAFGTLTRGMADFLRACVLLRKNIVVSGGTGSGKTTLLNVLSNYLPDDERILTIEDAAELRLAQPHLVRLEARPPNIEGRGAVTIRDLVRNALRMRPDRIIVGECRGGEALDMLQAMNTGHDGSLTTVHANAPRDVVSRLETMVMMSGLDLPSRAIREQIASAIDLVVHESRFPDGSRKVVAISEVTGLEGQQVVMQDLFVYEQTGIGADGRVAGRFVPTGAVPAFFGEFAVRGIPLDVSVFSPPAKP
ncbi:MAG: Flp pilus assembly complex ATPase component TadA [Kiritimatiellae bacterium]|nr:Flp pilus assembly complex ATPase component TadA [Kiritimatiellia bacterium]